MNSDPRQKSILTCNLSGSYGYTKNLALIDEVEMTVLVSVPSWVWCSQLLVAAH